MDKLLGSAKAIVAALVPTIGVVIADIAADLQSSDDRTVAAIATIVATVIAVWFTPNKTVEPSA